MDHARKTVSYVFPVYNEGSSLRRLYEVTAAVVEKIDYNVELLFINDGSSDSSLDILMEFVQEDPRVVVIDLARNFGHQKAVTAGLDAASGDAVIIMDSDLQDPPQVSLELLALWEQGFDVVYAQRRTRRDTMFKKATAALFYMVLQRISVIDIPPNTGDFRLLDRKVVDEVNKFREQDRFLRGMVSFVGFRQAAVLFDRDQRFAGETGYSVRKMVQLAAAGIFGFSTFPLTIISRFGYFTASLSVLGVLYALAMKLFVPYAVVEGWTFIVISILFVGGLQLIMLGVLGGYIGRIYKEVQRRPLYSVRSIHRS